MNENRSSSRAQPALLLRAAQIVLPDGLLSDASLLIEEGRIARVLAAGEGVPREVATSFDLSGLTLLPGFIDVHIHGAVGRDTMAATGADLHRVAKFLVEQGVTGWLPTFVPAPDEDYRRATAAVAQLMAGQDDGPPVARALGIHYEGPFVNSAQCGALRIAHFREYRRVADLDALATVDAPGAARMMTLAPEIEGGIELVRELRRRGWIISIGHTRASVDALDQAHEAGARHLTHFMNAMPPLHHRAPGPIGWGLARDDVTCDIIADGIHLDPLVLRLVWRCKTAEQLVLISDAVAPAGSGEGAYEIWGETITVENGRTRNARGNIAGSVITMGDAVRMMLSLGVPLSEVARMAATTPARLLGIDQDYGSIEEGKRADLVALDAERQARLTLVGGRVAFDALSDS